VGADYSRTRVMRTSPNYLDWIMARTSVIYSRIGEDGRTRRKFGMPIGQRRSSLAPHLGREAEIEIEKGRSERHMPDVEGPRRDHADIFLKPIVGRREFAS
jgi:hypothetical protein